MKVKLILLVLLSVAFGDDSTRAPVVFSNTQTWDCGAADKVITFHAGDIHPSPILYPGNLTLDADMEVTRDIPSDHFMVRLMLEKLEPFKMLVPCFENIGSCVYGVCNDVLPNNREAFCKMGACECPFTKKVYTGSGIPFTLPDLGGAIFAKILEGNFVGNVTFFDSANDLIYGCLGMSFAIKADV